MASTTKKGKQKATFAGLNPQKIGKAWGAEPVLVREAIVNEHFKSIVKDISEEKREQKKSSEESRKIKSEESSNEVKVLL
jgi:hypothetical protein